jgi:hypothetical protein
MKAKDVGPSVEGVCEQLSRSRLLAADEVQHLEQRWRQEAREPGELGAFARWLVANQFVTEFQVAMLLHGHAGHLFAEADPEWEDVSEITIPASLP